MMPYNLAISEDDCKDSLRFFPPCSTAANERSTGVGRLIVFLLFHVILQDVISFSRDIRAFGEDHFAGESDQEPGVTLYQVGHGLRGTVRGCSSYNHCNRF